jgi:class 3 adenylate cyclase
MHEQRLARAPPRAALVILAAVVAIAWVALARAARAAPVSTIEPTAWELSADALRPEDVARGAGSWSPVAFPMRPDDPVTAEAVWLRTSVDLPPDTLRTDLAAATGCILGTWTLYANGVAIASGGEPGGRLATVDRIASPLPLPAVDDGRVSLALRAVRPSVLRAGGFARVACNPVLLGPAPLVQAVLTVEGEASRRAADHMIVFAVLMMTAGLYHLYLSRRRRELDGYLWFGLVLLDLGVWATVGPLVHYHLVPLDDVAILPVSSGVSAVGVALTVEFHWRFLRGKPPPTPVRVLQAALGAAGLLYVLLGVHVVRVVPPPTRELLVAVGLLLALAVAGREAYRGNVAARTIVGAFAILVVLVLFQIHRQLDTASPAPLVKNVSIGPLAGVLLMVLAMGVALANSFARTMARLDETHRAARRFVPFEFLELLGKPTITEVKKGDQVALDMSILFSDLRGFTTRAERMGPQETFAFINRYLAHMEPALHEQGGFINDIFGDGIMALFHTGADAAVRAALGMVRGLHAMNAARADGDEVLRMGIGIHSGPLALGTIGGRDRLDCTVVGDPANVASRVESMTKLYGATMLITEATAQRLADRGAYSLREVDLVQAKGKSEPIRVYEVLDADDPELRARKEAGASRFAAALERYRRGSFVEAANAFETCEREAPADGSARLYVTRCAELIATPPAAWDGVTRLEGK